MKNRKNIIALLAAEILILLVVISAIGYEVVGPGAQLAQVNSGFNTGGQGVALGSKTNLDSALCTGYNDDQDYLYRLATNIFTKDDGTKSFTLNRMSDNKPVRQWFADEKFFVDRSGGSVTTTYDIVQKCGGVDVVYTVRNNALVAKSLPDLRVDGVMQKTTGDFYVLDTKDSGYIRNAKGSNGNPPNQLYGGGGVNYPGFFYSPAMITHDNDFAVGSALLYPYLQYKHAILPQMTKVTSGIQAGTWRHEYRDFQYERFGDTPRQNATLAAGEQRTYTVTLRFSPARNWILTLFPYKAYFKGLYGEVDQVRPKDQKPVAAIVAINENNYDVQTNPRSYENIALINQGWGPVVDRYLANAQARGFSRVMIWAPSGLYNPEDPRFTSLNYPMQFMDFLPHLTNTVGEFSKFAQNNIQLGFWWGLSGYVPIPDRWEPDSKVLADYANQTHINFLNNQLSLAYQRGAKTIGLDAYDGNVYNKYPRLDELKRLTNNQVQFIHENSGPDIIHRKVANFYTPTAYSWWTQYDKSTLAGPDVLSNYINKGAEIWVLHDVKPPFCDTSKYTQSYSWGFTPVIGSCPTLNLRELNFTLVACFDGIDNDHNGKTDWPYDQGCESATDNSEFLDGITPPRNLGSSDNVNNNGGNNDDGSGGDGTGDGGGTTGGYSRSALLSRIQQLQALIKTLQDMLAGLSVGNVGDIPTDLTLGSQGNNVTLLQQYLASKGYLTLPAGVNYGYFGYLTRSALVRFQAANGVVPATGYFGPLTRSKIKSLTQ